MFTYDNVKEIIRFSIWDRSNTRDSC